MTGPLRWTERCQSRSSVFPPAVQLAGGIPTRHPGVVRPPPEAMLLALVKETEGGAGGERPEAACARPRRAPKARLDP
jgi:hypothetical protein